MSVDIPSGPDKKSDYDSDGGGEDDDEVIVNTAALSSAQQSDNSEEERDDQKSNPGSSDEAGDVKINQEESEETDVVMVDTAAIVKKSMKKPAHSDTEELWLLKLPLSFNMANLQHIKITVPETQDAKPKNFITSTDNKKHTFFLHNAPPEEFRHLVPVFPETDGQPFTRGITFCEQQSLEVPAGSTKKEPQIINIEPFVVPELKLRVTPSGATKRVADPVDPVIPKPAAKRRKISSKQKANENVALKVAVPSTQPISQLMCTYNKVILLVLASCYLVQCTAWVRLLPPYRASSITTVELSLVTPWVDTASAVLSVIAVPNSTNLQSIILVSSETFIASSTIPSSWELDISVLAAGRYQLEIQVNTTTEYGSADNTAVMGYEVVDTGVNSTLLLDGAFIDIVHWSESEALMYNYELREMTNEDWDDEIKYMADAGIRTAILQTVFDNGNEYVTETTQTCENYYGYAFYPSTAYPNLYPNFTDDGDKLEAILSACDKYGVTIYVGVGLFAWFDFTTNSLCWHQNVFEELMEMYGQHSSIQGWYVSEEMFGSFFFETPQFYYLGNVYAMEYFFRILSQQIYDANPLHLVALAINSQDFGSYMSDWKKVLQYVDVLLPFGFARDSSFDTLTDIQEVCDATSTRLWVDMELFQYPIGDEGLIPKDLDSIIAEIDSLYTTVENIVGYEFTGLMDSPDSPVHLGGDAAAELYEDYLDYYIEQTSNPSV